MAGITESDFLTFQQFFYQETGIHFDLSKRYFVDKRLLDRMEATQHTTFRSYLNKLRFERTGNELQKLTNSLTVNETYFFREEYQFRCLVTSILDEVVAHRTTRAPIRIWSLPSSSGEEPYSIALYLLEHWPMLQEWDVEIVASDIDTDILLQAQRAHFSPRSVQNLPPALLTRYFTASRDGFQLCDDLRESVSFTRVNLADQVDTQCYRDFDVVFCRNLLIYFNELSRRQAAEAIFSALSPGGFVCLGHSESMSRISPLFQVRKFPDAIVHQKPRGTV